jgi:hypothetical protein
VAYCDPEQGDPALSEMVPVGCSMGGLVSKLQIINSGEALWDRIANRPIDKIDLTMNQRELIDRLFHFEPLPFVKREVFIGSPHQGSPFATSWVGRRFTAGHSALRSNCHAASRYETESWPV